ARKQGEGIKLRFEMPIVDVAHHRLQEGQLRLQHRRLHRHRKGRQRGVVASGEAKANDHLLRKRRIPPEKGPLSGLHQRRASPGRCSTLLPKL
ncbi:unnamed protein product, partial [Pylaiella littoralis]